MEYIIFFVLMYYIYTVNKRVATLEQQLKIKPLPPPVAAVAQTASAITPPVAASSTAPTTFIPHHAVPIIPQPENAFIAWLKRDFLVKVGILLLLIAFGWFVSYAFVNNWIGPIGRIILGVLAGVAFLTFGYLRARTEAHQGALFAAFGSTIVLLTIFAAREIYGFLTPTIALSIMFVSIVAVAYLAVRLRLQSLAIAGLVLGLLAPFLTNATDSSALTFFSYVTVIIVGSMWVATRLQADILLFVTYVLVALYSAPFIFSSEEAHITILFGFLFTIIFFAVNLKTMLGREAMKPHTVDLVTAVGIGLYVASWIEFSTILNEKVLIYLGWALIFALGAFLIYRRTNDPIPLTVYSAVAIGLVAAATGHQFSGSALTIAYTIEAAFVVGLSAFLVQKQETVLYSSLLFIGPLLLSLEDIGDPVWDIGVIHPPLFSLLILTVSLLASGVSVRLTVEKETKPFVSNTLIVIGSLYVATLIWLITHSLLYADFATMISLLTYTVVGLVAYVKGVSIESKGLQMYGGTVIGCVVARLLLVEVWQMELAGRIVTFFAIGILLISTAFIKKLQKKEAV